jgi:tetratricopeptide (TPR) repeat protein
VSQDDSGAYRVIDWYQLTRGQMASDSLGALARLMTDPDQSFLHRLFATTPFSPDLAEKFKQISVLDHQGKFADALTALSQLPPEIADSLDVLRMRSAEAARLNNNQEYYHILDIMAAKYSNEPSAAMALIDYYIKNRQFDKAQTGITIIENRVGSDGMTNMMHSNIAQQAGNYSAAAAYGRKSVEVEPDFRRGWFALATSYVLLKDYPGAVSAFREMQTRFGAKYSRQVFVGKQGWDGFAQSDAFKKWLPQ